MNILIRHAVLDDYPGLCTIYAELDDLHHTHHPELFIKPQDHVRAREYIADIIADDTKALFVGEAAGRIVGFAECCILKASSFPVLRPREWVQLDNIAVLEEFRHQRVGSMFLEKVIAWAREKEINRLELKVYAFNEGAVGFYAGKGFRDLNKTMYLNL